VSHVIYLTSVHDQAWLIAGTFVLIKL